MVARSPPKQQRTAAAVAPLPLSPTLLRETVKKVERCVSRLQELQYTVAGGTKMVSGVRLSPNSTRTYLRTSLLCKHQSLRIKTTTCQTSPGKLPKSNSGDTSEEWQRMSLPAMLLGETMTEILQAAQFARTIVDAVSSEAKKPTTDDPKTPLTERRKPKQTTQHSELHARRRMEKQTMRSESDKPSSVVQRAKSQINFKASSSPLHKRDCNKENCRYIANRVSPRNRPWARKTVLFPNPLFHSSSPPTSKHQKFAKTYSPVVTRNRQTPHKFLMKSPRPPPSSSKFHVKIKPPPLSISPTRAAKKASSPSAAAKLRRSFSPSKLANRLVSPLKNRNCVPKNEGSSMMTTAAKLRRSFSPSRIANRLVSPLKSRKLVVHNKNEGNIMVSGLKQRPMSLSAQFSPPRI